jgi:hypothetical protein
MFSEILRETLPDTSFRLDTWKGCQVSRTVDDGLPMDDLAARDLLESRGCFSSTYFMLSTTGYCRSR